RASLMNAAVDLTGFAIGAYWGPFGIALSYAIGQLIKLPVTISYQLRKSHVTARDVFGTIALFCGTGLVSALAVYGVSRLVADHHLLVRLVACGGCAVLFYYGLLHLFPRGRRAVADVFSSAALLRRSK